MAAAESILTAYVVLTGVVSKEDDNQFVSYCRELGSSSCGSTIDEAFENLGDAIEVHLNALEETGEITNVLRERNINLYFDPPPEQIVVPVAPGQTIRLFKELVPSPAPA